MKFRLLASVSIFALLSACSVFNPATSGPVAAPQAFRSPATPPESSPESLGSINGQALRVNQFSPAIQRQLRDVENEFAQRRMHLIWAGIEDTIDQRLLKEAAKARGLSIQALKTEKIDSLLREPSEDELRIIYDLNKTSIGVPYEIAEPFLRRRLQEEQREELQTMLLGSLREGASIDYKIPVPDLPRVKISAGNSPSIGAPDAKVTLIEFSDFQCPYCNRAREVIEELRSLYPDDLRIVFRDFPLKQHPRAHKAAQAAQCAHKQGKFWDYHNLLFSHPDALEDRDLREYARQLQLSPERFSACLSSGEASKIVEENRLSGKRYGVNGTPAIYINGIKLVGLLPLPLIKAIINKELGR
ncbi:MAG: DsbA family protein [Myxococcota bacterium]|nr:DsbA family protein [Myxococcota bacterium]